MEIFEAPAFTRYLPRYLEEDEYRRLQNALVVHLEVGDVMPGTGGFRKMRWTDARRRKGRRGGLRVIYYYFSSDQRIWLMTIYDKNEASDLTPTERRPLRLALEAELQARAAKRAAGHRSRRIQ
jgi:mRNA-degrading endonuclease RelE of RelBE toxin-antitoxin system